jgi:hypothetical protein
LAYLSEQAGSKLNITLPDTVQSTPSITLGLTQDSFKLQLGCQFDIENFSASWANLSTITNAISTEEKTDCVIFHFKNGQSISVSTETGLMIKDDFPRTGSTNDRYIALHSLREFDDALKYEQLIPKFSLLTFKKQPATQFEEAFTLSFLQSLGEKLAGDEDLDSILNEKKEEIQKAILPLIRKQIHKRVVEDIDPAITEKMKNNIIMPYYQNHLKNNPDTSFDEFLDLMMYEAKKDPQAMIPAEALEFTRELNHQSKEMLAQLSEESREPISKIMDVTVPIVIEAFMLEFFEQTINGMRTSE